jgi:hypothetical protein
MFPIPSYLYDRARQIADETSQPVDQVILNRLEGALSDPFASLPPDEQAELKALSYLSDEPLWAIAREQMASDLQDRMLVLMDKNNFGTISQAEYEELEHLVELGHRLMLRKAQAALLLQQRGHKVTPSDLSPANE